VRTKTLGTLLLVGFIVLEFLYADFNWQALMLKSGIAGSVLLFLLFAQENRSKYYSAFWAESIPILWWILLVLVQ
jgi:hypothetical protein